MTSPHTDLEPRVLLDTCLAVCEDRQAMDIRAFDVRGNSTLADYFVFCSGNSTAHIQAIANHIDRGMREIGISARAMEGTPESRWMLVDYNDVLIHIFHPEAREFYNIEALLRDVEQIYPV